MDTPIEEKKARIRRKGEVCNILENHFGLNFDRAALLCTFFSADSANALIRWYKQVIEMEDE